MELNITNELRKCGFLEISRLGQGTYGIVYKIVDKDNKPYALKYILPEKDFEKLGITNLVEIDVMSRFNHPNLIHSCGVLTKNKYPIQGLAIMEPLGYLTLRDLGNVEALSLPDKLKILYKLTRAVDFLHDNGVLHLDIKQSNVVLTKDHHPYLIDFGLSIYVDDAKIGTKFPGILVTTDYRPPEIVAGGRMYNSAVDVYSLGMLFLYTCNGRDIFRNLDTEISDQDLLQLIYTYITPVNINKHLRGLPEDLKNLIINMLHHNPNKRPTVKQIWQNPIFTQETIEATTLITDISYDYSSDHRDIIKLIIHWCPKYIPTSVLFAAIDLYNRVGSFYKDKSMESRLIVATTCLFMASKLLDNILLLDSYVLDVNKLAPNVTQESIIQIERDIVQHLQGILYVSNLYKACKTGDELRTSFADIVLAKDSSVYARLDIPQWTKNMKEANLTEEYPSKNILVSDLYT